MLRLLLACALALVAGLACATVNLNTATRDIYVGSPELMEVEGQYPAGIFGTALDHDVYGGTAIIVGRRLLFPSAVPAAISTSNGVDYEEEALPALGGDVLQAGDLIPRRR